MKNIFLFFITLSIMFSNLSFSQDSLSLEDAVLKRWTSLYPERLKDLTWNNKDDFFSYKTSDSLLYICDTNFSVKDSILLKDLNKFFDPENKLVVIPSIHWVSSHSFRFRHNNRYYNYNIQRGENPNFLFELNQAASHIEFNNQNEKCAYTIANNLYIVNQSNQHTQITHNIDSAIICGQPVHRYEFGIYKGIFWSNQGDKLAFYRKDESMVTDYPLLNHSSRVGHVDMIKYPMAGMASHHVSLGIFNSSNNQIIYIDSGEPKEQYLTNIAWGPKDKYIYIAILNRDQNHLKLNQYSAIDGAFVRTLFEEISDKYVQPLHPMEFISNHTFLWRSEREGYDNFYLYDTEGQLIKKLLNKNHLVKDFYGYRNDNVFFSSYSKDGLGIDLWNVGINKKYRKKIVNDGSFHSFQISPSKSYFIDQFSNLEVPLITQIINNKGDLIKELLVSNNPLINYKIGHAELAKIKTDNNTYLNTRLIKPYDFDENKKYPVLIYVYNGPGVQLIRNNWLASAPLWMHYLANQGYLVFSVDGRGSENRGRDFEQVIFRELGKTEMIDQIKGYDYLIKKSFVDKNRIAVHGWSYGGFMTTNLLLNYPHLFTCGVAGGPVTNWLYYEIMYTERYMDHPENNQKGYEKTNLINQVHLLEDPLLMIHGLMDDIVVPKHSLDFIKASVKNNIQMDYFIYPGHPHNVRGKDRLHLIQKIIDYIRENNN